VGQQEAEHASHCETGAKKFAGKSFAARAELAREGEIFGNEDLLVDGSVEGIVVLDEQKLMIGPTAKVKADIIAGEVIIRGNLKGSIRARGRIEIRNDGAVTGDLTTPQVFIEEGGGSRVRLKSTKAKRRNRQEHSFWDRVQIRQGHRDAPEGRLMHHTGLNCFHRSILTNRTESP